MLQDAIIPLSGFAREWTAAHEGEEEPRPNYITIVRVESGIGAGNSRRLFWCVARLLLDLEDYAGPQNIIAGVLAERRERVMT
jgi:hypothetical protein